MKNPSKQRYQEPEDESESDSNMEWAVQEALKRLRKERMQAKAPKPVADVPRSRPVPIPQAQPVQRAKIQIGMKSIGTKEEVFEGLATQTRGGLRKKDLTVNSRGQVVSLKKSLQAKRVFGRNDEF
jgi:hypothetical protein